jgi:chemotaxis protein CheD
VEKDPRRLEAQIIGGAHVKGASTHRSDAVIASIRVFLERKGIRIVSEDVGGVLGRKIVFNTSTGDMMTVKTSRIRRTDWIPEWVARYGAKRIAFPWHS